MKTQRPWTLPLLSLLAVLTSAITANAQYGQPMGAPGAGPYGQMPAGPMGGYPGGGMGSVPQYPPQFDQAMAAGYAGAPQGPPGMGMPGMPGMGPGMGPPGMGGMSPYGADQAGYSQMGDGQEGYENYSDQPCPECGEYQRGRTLCQMVFGGAGGRGTVSSPRWFDISAEAVMFKRRSSTNGVPYSLDKNDGSFLTSNDLKFKDAFGFRTTAALQVGPGSDIEFTFLGGLNNSSTAQKTGAGDLTGLFSPFGNFGSPGSPFGLPGVAGIDQATLQTVAYSSSMNSFELNHRRRWQAAMPRLQGSWLIGARHLDLVEDFQFNSYTDYAVARSQFQSLTRTTNALTGLQVGGDAWFTLLPGLMIGADAKIGIYGNHATDRGAITSVPTVFISEDHAKRNSTAFVGETGLSVVYKLTHNWSIKGGYQLLYLDGMALATENFNTTVPTGPTRPGHIISSGTVLYHSALLGAEYMW